MYFVAAFIFPKWVSNNSIFHVCDDACAIQRNIPCMWTAPRFSLWSFWYITVEKEQSSVTGSTNFRKCWRMIWVCRICAAGRSLEFSSWPFVSGTLVDYHCELDPQRWSAWLCRQRRPFHKCQRLVCRLSLYIDVVIGLRWSNDPVCETPTLWFSKWAQCSPSYVSTYDGLHVSTQNHDVWIVSSQSLWTKLYLK